MTLKWKETCSDTGREPQAQTTGELIADVIDAAPDYYAGELESMRAKQRKLTQILASLIDLLPDDVQRNLVGEHVYRQVEERA